MKMAPKEVFLIIWEQERKKEWFVRSQRFEGEEVKAPLEFSLKKQLHTACVDRCLIWGCKTSWLNHIQRNRGRPLGE